MKRLIKKSSRHLKKLTTLALTCAMTVGCVGVGSFDSDAASKPKIGVKVGNGILVVKKGKKVNLKVTPKKKVTFKSSKPSVIKVNKKGVVKAVKKGSAKITVKKGKKKATITVKTGTPITKVSINSSAKHTWNSDVFTLIPNGTMADGTTQYKKSYPEHKETIKKTSGTFTIVQGGTATIKASLKPSKATYKKLLWKATKNSSKISISGSSTKATVVGLRLGTATVTVKAKDGSGKKATFKVKVVSPTSDKTPAPTEEPDTRRLTKVQDFDDIADGTNWDKYTSAGKSQGKMTVVNDPEATADANGKINKVLKIEFNDDTNASYDFAPVFSVDLATLKDPDGNSTANKKLSDYTGVKADIRVVGDHGDCGGEQVKQIYCYFDKYGNIKQEDKFAASANKTKSGHVDSSGENVVEAGASNEDKTLRFGVDIPHALGQDKEVSRTLFNGKQGRENLKNMPAFSTSKWKMEDKSTWYTDESCGKGYKPYEDATMSDGTPCIAGFTDRYMIMNKDRINELDTEILKSSKFDVVFGSTYAGKPSYFEDGYTKNNGFHSVTLYVDNVCMVEQPVAITGFTVSAKGATETSNAEIIAGTKGGLEFKYTPEDTTQKEMTYSTDNDQVKVVDGQIQVAEDFKFAEGEKSKEVTITVTSKANPSLTQKVKVNIVPAETADEPLVLTLDMLDKDMSDGDTLNDDGTVKNAGPTIEAGTDPDGKECWVLKFGANNQRLMFKLPESVDLNKYYKMEVVGDVPAQMTTEFFDESFNLDVKTGVTKTEAGNSIEWWEAKNGYLTGNTYPFFEGSHSERLEDGTSVTKGVETFEKKIQDIKNEKATKDVDKTLYISLGTNQKPKGKWEANTYYIYSFRFIPKTGNEPEEPAVDTATAETAEATK